MDDIIVFNPLNQEHLTLIIDIQLKRVSKLLATKGIHLEVTKRQDVLMAEGYDPTYGARPHAARHPAADSGSARAALLSGDFAEGDTVVVEGNAGKHALRALRGAWPRP